MRPKIDPIWMMESFSLTPLEEGAARGPNRTQGDDLRLEDGWMVLNEKMFGI